MQKLQFSQLLSYVSTPLAAVGGGVLKASLTREVCYNVTQQHMDEWVGLIKLNRQKQCLNLCGRVQDESGVNSFPSQPISALHQSITSELKQMNLQSARAVIGKEQLTEARKHRNMVFYEEIKNRRIAKIKSKEYRRRRKREKLVKSVREEDDIHGQSRSTRDAKIRIRQRITLRHSLRNKHIMSLQRFKKSEKDSIQNSINQVNGIRNRHLQRVVGEEEEEEGSQGQLQGQIEEIEKKGIDGMRFMNQGMEEQEVVLEDDGEVKRRTYGMERNIMNVESNIKNTLSMRSKSLVASELTTGIDVSRLKQRYMPIETALTVENERLLLSGMHNEAAAINFKQFQQQMEDQSEPKRESSNWGQWSGPGIVPKRNLQQEIKRRMAKIEEIKNRNKHKNVIVNNCYNKNLKEYFVHKLPHQCGKVEQFQMMQQRQIGPQWNSMMQFKDNIQERVKTKKGRIIKPAQLPKSDV